MPTSEITRRRHKPTKRSREKREANRALYGELNGLATDLALENPGRKMYAAEILQQVLERCFGHWAYAQQQVNALEPQMLWYQDVFGAWHRNKWYNLELSLSRDLERICGLIENLGLSDRMAQVEEAKALLVGKYMATVFDAIELTPAQKKQLRPAMADALPILEGVAA